MSAHTDLVSTVLYRLGTRPDVRLWKQNNGLMADYRQAHSVRGIADLSGIVVGSGRRLEVECKVFPDTPSKAQRMFAGIIREAGGIYLVAAAENGSEAARERAAVEVERALASAIGGAACFISVLPASCP